MPFRTYSYSTCSIVSIALRIWSVINMKATVKEHSEYKGVKQTVIARPKLISIA